MVEEAIKAINPDETYFWATHNGAELDLLLVRNGYRLGIECKYKDAPQLTPSMRISIQDLDLDHLVVIYPGDRPYPLADRVTVLPLSLLKESPPDPILGMIS